MLICVTNRKICTENFLETIENSCKKADILILREKDLNEEEYLILAEKVQKICKDNNCKFFVNKYVETAKKINADGLQLSFRDFIEYSERKKSDRIITGCSVHSVEEAESACEYGADFLIAGHIFPTDCKKGLPPRGLDFLKSVVIVSNVPVYAIGGINKQNLIEIVSAGAKGGCIMSGFMQNKI